MAAGHLELGRAGEDAAWEMLRAKGYALLERNWSKNRFELDLVCEDGDTVVFVEVKTRGVGMRGHPSDALTPDKMRKLVKAAAYYLSKEQFWDRPCRFDLVSLSGEPGNLQAEHFTDAFDLSQVPGASRIWQP
ncbi:MAG: YraN family protein [Proteobacteria bacterium]|nr:YraN family protein [Pseudomonadota bacterium]MBU1611323.1 YraN family protein [Pseudomonadota bacterium]